ncbi:MAG: ATP-binding protein [Candidatus Izemoplasmatales bacterium]|nr:ATP-binding protein [Candidatus Izemoplasmatales bacterium]
MLKLAKENEMREFNYAQIAERSLMKTYKGPIYAKFIEAIDRYQLFAPGDKIAVALSGGKDSLLLAKLFQAFAKYGFMDVSTTFFTMDPGYREGLMDQHRANCERLGIELKTFPANIFAVTEKMSPESPCFLCARMRRGVLYAKAKELGCNKLALGHHFDDVIETTLLNLFYTGTFKTMLPKAKAENFPGMELIRPMYLIKEKDVVRFTRYNKLNPIDCGCRFVETRVDSKRKEVKELIDELRKRYINSDINIFRAAENVNLAGVLGYYDDEARHSFMDEY